MKVAYNNVFPGNMIDASVFNTLKMLKMIEKSVLPQLPNVAESIYYSASWYKSFLQVDGFSNDTPKHRYKIKGYSSRTCYN